MSSSGVAQRCLGAARPVAACCPLDCKPQEAANQRNEQGREIHRELHRFRPQAEWQGSKSQSTGKNISFSWRSRLGPAWSCVLFSRLGRVPAPLKGLSRPIKTMNSGERGIMHRLPNCPAFMIQKELITLPGACTLNIPDLAARTP